MDMFEHWLDFEDSPKGKCVKISGLHCSGLPFEFNAKVGIHTMTLLEAKMQNSKGEESSLTCCSHADSNYKFIIDKIASLPINGQQEEILFKNSDKYMKTLEPQLKQDFLENSGIDVDALSEHDKLFLTSTLGKMSEFFFEDKSLGEGIVTDFSILGDGNIWASVQNKPDNPVETRNDAIKISAITSIGEVPQFLNEEQSSMISQADDLVQE